MAMSYRLTAFLAVSFAHVLRAQQPEFDVRAARPAAMVSPAANFRTNADLVLVPVIVTNRAGETVDGLTASSFTVLEDHNPRPIVSFGGEDAPSSVGVIVDLSGSMQSKAGIAAGAMRAFLDTANPEDEAFLLTVSTRPGKPTSFTNNFGELEAELSDAKPGGATALTDTIALALTQLRGARHPHRALLIVSDGMDNHSRYSEGELLRIAEEADVQIYTIGMLPSTANRKAIELTEERNGLAFLDHLAERTGGLSFTLGGYENPVPTATRIGGAIRNQYLIGYRPEESEPGTFRSIQVKVSLPKMHVSTRTGYYAR
jgi:Ca-activated chloride channel family protein